MIFPLLKSYIVFLNLSGAVIITMLVSQSRYRKERATLPLLYYYYFREILLNLQIPPQIQHFLSQCINSLLLSISFQVLILDLFESVALLGFEDLLQLFDVIAYLGSVIL